MSGNTQFVRGQNQSDRDCFKFCANSKNRYKICE